MAPSPTADATLFTFPDRTSPTAKTPGRLVSSRYGGRVRGHALCCTPPSLKSRPVRMNPLVSSARHPCNQSVRGDAPVITNRCRIGWVEVFPVLLFFQV